MTRPVFLVLAPVLLPGCLGGLGMPPEAPLPVVELDAGDVGDVGDVEDPVLDAASKNVDESRR